MSRKFLVGLVCILVLSLPLITSATPTITVDGLDDDWTALEPSGQSITGQTKIWAFVANDNLHILVKGKMGDWNDILIDTDGKASTGHQSWIWPIGADFLLEDGSLFVSTGPGWDWNQIADIAYATTGEGMEKIIEMVLPLNLMGLTGNSAFSFGFSGGDQDIPKSGEKPFVFNK